MNPRHLALFVFGALSFWALSGQVRAECGDYVVYGDSKSSMAESSNSESGRTSDEMARAAFMGESDGSGHSSPLTRPCHGPNCGSRIPVAFPSLPLSYEVVVVDPGCLFRRSSDRQKPRVSRYPTGADVALTAGHPECVLRPPQA